MFSPKKWLGVWLISGLLLSFNHSFTQGKENSRETKLKDGQVLETAHPDLVRKRDEVWRKITDSHFFDKIDLKLQENGYKRYTMTGDFDINYQIVDLEIKEKPRESRIQSIENIDNIVKQLTDENNLVPTITRISFRDK